MELRIGLLVASAALVVSPVAQAGIQSVQPQKRGVLAKPVRTLATATASPGRGLRLQPSESLAEVRAKAIAAMDVEQISKNDNGVPAGYLRGLMEDTLRNLFPRPSQDQLLLATESPGCDTGVASPSIGADVPETYFGVPSPGANPSFPGAVQLLTSGVVDTDELTVTLPLYEGRMFGTNEEVWYISTDSTDQANAMALGLNHSAKLVFAETGRGVRTGTITGDGLLIVDQGRVDFTPDRNVVANAEPNPFPPAIAEPGSVGDSLYSPLIKIVNAGGHIYNMPVLGAGPADELLNSDGTPNYDNVHDSVVSIDFDDETVTVDLVAGFSFGRPVLYLSLDSNSPVAAALEGATLAPGMDDIDVGNDDSLFSAVERIFITINGPRGCENPQRQGLDAAVTDGGFPFNVLGGIPTIAPDYSPLWDANIGQWTPRAIRQGYRSRLIDEFQILSFVDFGFITGPGGAAYGSAGFIINCPIVHRFL